MFPSAHLLRSLVSEKQARTMHNALMEAPECNPALGEPGAVAELLDELQERRQHAMADPSLAPLANQRPIPALAQIFTAWPSSTIDANTAVQACGNALDLHHHLGLAMARIYRRELPPPALIENTFRHLQAQGTTSLNQLNNLANPDLSAAEVNRLPEAFGWLLKHGFAEVAQP